MSRAQRGLIVLGALAVTLFSGWVALVGIIWGFGLKCDDGCSGDPQSWDENADAWQWNAFGAATLVLFAIAVGVLVLAARRRERDAAVAFAVWLVAATALFVLLQV
jgi:hypothetical protein